jgi:hypothetical protein
MRANFGNFGANLEIVYIVQRKLSQGSGLGKDGMQTIALTDINAPDRNLHKAFRYIPLEPMQSLQVYDL